MPEVNDQVSVNAYNGKCGPIVYTANLNGIDSIVTFDPKTRQLEFLTKNIIGIFSGVYSFVVKASLKNYTKVNGVDFTYTYNLKQCIVQTVAP